MLIMLKTGTSYSNEAKPKCSHDIGQIIYINENRPSEQTASKSSKIEEQPDDDLSEPLWTLIWEIMIKDSLKGSHYRSSKLF